MRIGEGLFVGNTMSNQRDKKLKDSLAKISSAKSITRAADNPSGLAISEKMKAQIRGLMQGSANTQDTQSMLQTADGGLETIATVLQRMRELSVQALNDTLTDHDRALADEEFQAAKTEISSIAKDTEFNTKQSYEEHLAKYQMISGNAVLTPPVKVEPGYNDQLDVWVDGAVKQVTLDDGEYDLDQFTDMLDTKLSDVDENIIVSLNSDSSTLNISAEGYQEMRLGGGASSFIYEYHLGRGPGTVYGSSDLSGELHVFTGHNDQFNFNIGSKKYAVTFPATVGGYSGKGYTADQIVSIMNTQLKAQGAKVNVFMHGNNLALDPGAQTIEGFSGNMIEIDGITSILYDNAKYGGISRTQGYAVGRVDLSAGATITAANDTLIPLPLPWTAARIMPSPCLIQPMPIPMRSSAPSIRSYRQISHLFRLWQRKQPNPEKNI